jgi:hypothetical protein
VEKGQKRGLYTCGAYLKPGHLLTIHCLLSRLVLRFTVHHSPFSSVETVRQPHTGLTSDHSQLSIVELFRAEGAH